MISRPLGNALSIFARVTASPACRQFARRRPHQHLYAQNSTYTRRPLDQRCYLHNNSSSSSSSANMAPQTSIPAFQSLLSSLTTRPGGISSSPRILALCGAGLSASSGLPTFRGAGGLWRNHDPTSLATPEAFESDPALVWLFYAWRRHMALKAQPNKGHFALAKLAEEMGEERFLCLTQNVDGEFLSSMYLLGSLSDICCCRCGFYSYSLSCF